MNTVHIDGQPIADVSFDDAVDAVVGLAYRDASSMVVTANLHHLRMLRAGDDEFAQAYSVAEHRFADGMPLLWTSKLGGSAIRERVTGADLEPAVCQRLAAVGGAALYIGGSPEVNDQAVANRAADYPGLKTDGISPPLGYDTDDTKTGSLLEYINDTVNPERPTAIFLCTGAPKSEKWAARNLQAIGHGVIVPAGAAVDFVAGAKVRADEASRRLGLEWFTRLKQEPGRLGGRYARDAVFLAGLAMRSVAERLTNPGDY